tara:strand:- start:34 stop:687 length:654 start_codon:yes stop_codon:yes gene_type:complete
LNNSFNYIISPEKFEFRKFSPKLKIGILASGKGTNFQELINLSEKNLLDIDIKILITNKETECIERAVKANIPYKLIKENDYPLKKLFEAEIINTLLKSEVELVVMAGWMKIVSSDFVSMFKNKIINIHPSLLPSYKGYKAIEEALSSGSKITGCSVHFVETEVDSGTLIMQAALPILEDDNIDSLSKKIQKLEHTILPHSISNAGYLIRKNIKDNY